MAHGGSAWEGNGWIPMVEEDPEVGLILAKGVEHFNGRVHENDRRGSVFGAFCFPRRVVMATHAGSTAVGVPTEGLDIHGEGATGPFEVSTGDGVSTVCSEVPRRDRAGPFVLPTNQSDQKFWVWYRRGETQWACGC